MPKLSWKKESRKDWVSEHQNVSELPTNLIQLGAILRIADATEAMSANWQILSTERDQYKKWYHEEREKLMVSSKSLDYSRRTATRYRNEINRLKTEIKRLKGQSTKDDEVIDGQQN